MRLSSEMTATRSSYTILIVNPCSQDRELYRNCLLADVSRCYTVLESDSATNALMVCQSNRVDSILTDYILPDATGLDFIQQLQGLNGICPSIVMVAGEADLAIAVRAMKLGVEDLLDITDRKLAEQEREHLLEQERAARADAERAN